MSVFPRQSLARVQAERCECPLMVYHAEEMSNDRVATKCVCVDLQSTICDIGLGTLFGLHYRRAVRRKGDGKGSPWSSDFQT